MRIIGGPAVLLAAMLNGETQRKAVITFCDEVMAYKETKERDREKANQAIEENKKQL